VKQSIISDLWSNSL